MQTRDFEENEYDMLLSRSTKRRKRRKHKAFMVICLCLVAILAVLAGAYFCLFTPEKRLDRSLSRAAEAFSKNDYAEAEKQYKKALSIDDENVAAMLGMLRIYDKKDMTDELKAAFEEYLAVIDKLDKFKLAENKDDIVSIYLFAEKTYADETDRLISIYENAYANCDKSEVIAKRLIENYLCKAMNYASSNDLDNEILYYDKVLMLDAENEAKKMRRERIIGVLDKFIADELFDEADEVILKYKDYVGDVDFEAYADEVSQKRAIHDAKYELLTSVYEYMSKKDYASMMKIDGSANANFVGKNITSSCVFTPEEGEVKDYTGIAAAIVPFKEEAYYFYYGDFVDGKCQGNGVLFLMTDEKNGSYYTYDGAWSDGKPNGEGKVLAFHEYDDISKLYVTREESGSFKEGLQNGKMKGKVVVNDTETYTGSWSTKNGVPKDVSGKYTDYPFNVPEGKVLYAVLLNEDKSVGWGSWISKNGHLGVLPFVN